MVPFIRDKYALFIPLAIFALAKEGVCISEVPKTFAFKIAKLKKITNIN